MYTKQKDTGMTLLKNIRDVSTDPSRFVLLYDPLPEHYDHFQARKEVGNWARDQLTKPGQTHKTYLIQEVNADTVIVEISTW